MIISCQFGAGANRSRCSGGSAEIQGQVFPPREARAGIPAGLRLPELEQGHGSETSECPMPVSSCQDGGGPWLEGARGSPECQSPECQNTSSCDADSNRWARGLKFCLCFGPWWGGGGSYLLCRQAAALGRCAGMKMSASIMVRVPKHRLGAVQKSWEPEWGVRAAHRCGKRGEAANTPPSPVFTLPNGLSVGGVLPSLGVCGLERDRAAEQLGDRSGTGQSRRQRRGRSPGERGGTEGCRESPQTDEHLRLLLRKAGCGTTFLPTPSTLPSSSSPPETQHLQLPLCRSNW